MADSLSLTLLNPRRPEEDFPPVELAWDEPNGLLAVGGDLSTARLLKAYQSGIFPWFGPQEPIYWWAPNPRAVLHPQKIRISRSLRKSMRNKGYRVTFDQDFPAVIQACAAPRAYADSTWICHSMQQAYIRLHNLGHAHSVEVWDKDGALVGGLYGVVNGAIFCGESMFSYATDTSKIAFTALAYSLQKWGFRLIDCQLENPHLTSLGAENISRQAFTRCLQTYRQTINAPWEISFSMEQLADWRPSET